MMHGRRGAYTVLVEPTNVRPPQNPPRDRGEIPRTPDYRPGVCNRPRKQKDRLRLVPQEPIGFMQDPPGPPRAIRPRLLRPLGARPSGRATTGCRLSAASATQGDNQ